jgi:hypothetical protein
MGDSISPPGSLRPHPSHINLWKEVPPPFSRIHFRSLRFSSCCACFCFFLLILAILDRTDRRKAPADLRDALAVYLYDVRRIVIRANKNRRADAVHIDRDFLSFEVGNLLDTESSRDNDLHIFTVKLIEKSPDPPDKGGSNPIMFLRAWTVEDPERSYLVTTQKYRDARR